MKRQITIDATGKKLGRLATEVATILQGKDMPTYEKHVLDSTEVTIKNAGKLEIAERLDRGYKSYSGYPGGLKIEKGGKLMERRGIGELIKHAVSGMLPKNTHRSRLLTKIIIEE